MHYCEPRWHDGQLVDADFMILSEKDNVPSAFAACDAHVHQALRIMLEDDKLVRVRQVGNKSR